MSRTCSPVRDFGDDDRLPSPFFAFSMKARARIWTLPRPCGTRRAPRRAVEDPPVGKSAPGRAPSARRSRCRDCRSGRAGRRHLAEVVGRNGGRIPTAIPRSRSPAGSERGTEGRAAPGASRRSWGASRRFPCRGPTAAPPPPSPSGPRCTASRRPSRRRPNRSFPAVDQGVPEREVLHHAHEASYTALSPCGWYLPITSPTMRADFLYGLPYSFPARAWRRGCVAGRA